MVGLFADRGVEAAGTPDGHFVGIFFAAPL
jgi:hypothetical protein